MRPSIWTSWSETINVNSKNNSQPQNSPPETEGQPEMVSIELSYLRDLTTRNLQANRIIWALVKRMGGEALLFEDADTIAPFWQLEFSSMECDGQQALVINATIKSPEQIQAEHESNTKNHSSN